MNWGVQALNCIVGTKVQCLKIYIHFRSRKIKQKNELYTFYHAYIIPHVYLSILYVVTYSASNYGAPRATVRDRDVTLKQGENHVNKGETKTKVIFSPSKHKEMMEILDF